MPRGFVSQKAWQPITFKKYDLHHLCCKDVCAKFNLSAQVVVRVIAKLLDELATYGRDPEKVARQARKELDEAKNEEQG